MEVSSSIVSRWIKEDLKLAGIDVSFIKGQSTRAPSSSKASKTDLSVVDVLGSSSWSISCIWLRFYNKQIMNEVDAYQKTVFA